MIQGNVKIHRTFKKYFGLKENEINFSTIKEIPSTLLINGKGLFICDFNVTFNDISFTFLGKNKEVVRCENSSLEVIEDSNVKDYLEFIYNNKVAHLAAICKLWRF